ncbi:hypothetical protein LTR62_000379 [Meristemomyces frigidus]|uniref:Uncharacterized protein n=1 Tax=Meristemomyces frigidus TaxID=1508187 RepID=A0AAN7YM21_9PEZI|nr:hypothetical protein LTR62_000379 [Meristemomyces frigidus]
MANLQLNQFADNGALSDDHQSNLQANDSWRLYRLNAHVAGGVRERPAPVPSPSTSPSLIYADGESWTKDDSDGDSFLMRGTQENVYRLPTSQQSSTEDEDDIQIPDMRDVIETAGSSSACDTSSSQDEFSYEVKETGCLYATSPGADDLALGHGKEIISDLIEFDHEAGRTLAYPYDLELDVGGAEPMATKIWQGDMRYEMATMPTEHTIPDQAANGAAINNWLRHLPQPY